MRSASEAPSSPCVRSASAGVPHAGQPSTPKTVTRPRQLAPQRVAEAADRSVILEDEDGLVGSERAEPLRSKRFSHGMFTTASRALAPRGAPRASAPRAASPARTREDASSPSRSTRAATDLDAAPRARSDAETGRSRAGSRRSPPHSSTAQRRRAPRLLRASGLDDRHVGERGEQRDVANRLVRLPGPGRDESRVVERVDDLRPLARLVVDLLVRAGREEARERVDDGQRARGGRARRRSRPCPARRSRTRRSAPDTRARRRARGSRRRDRRRGRRDPRARRRGGRARRRTPRRRTRP